MDLKNILSKNQKKIKNYDSVSVLKNLDIAVEDRPYSIPQKKIPIASNKKISTQKTLIQQSGNKAATKWQQTDNKVETKWQQSSNKPIVYEQQTDNKLATELATELATNRQQTGNKVATNRQQTENKVATGARFSELVGLQKALLVFLAHECKNSRSKITDALTLEYISNSTMHSTGVIKTTIQRLEKKGLVTRVEFKNGRSGWSRYELPDHIYHDALRNDSSNKVTTKWQQTDNKVTTKWQQSGNKVVTELATELATNTPSSSSILNNNTTTEYLEGWDFNIAPYEEFGFSQSHIKQLSLANIVSAHDVEQSLIEFHYDLINNKLPPIKTTKLNFLMGLLRSGSSYVSEGYRSEQDAIIAEMARRKIARDKQILEEKFFAWESKLTEDEKINIGSKMPSHIRVFHMSYGLNNHEVKKWMMDYFLKLKEK